MVRFHEPYVLFRCARRSESLMVFCRGVNNVAQKAYQQAHPCCNNNDNDDSSCQIISVSSPLPVEPDWRESQRYHSQRLQQW